jgi:steroid delta-isomerase-like uncharacterized protein
MTSAAEIVRSFVAAINAQGWDKLSEIVAEDFVRHSLAGGDIIGRDNLISFLKAEFVTFPDAEERIDDLLVDGERVAVRHQFSGTQLGAMGPYEASGKRMSASYLAIYRLERGRIMEAWAEWDNLAGLKQLGHLPT